MTGLVGETGEVQGRQPLAPETFLALLRSTSAELAQARDTISVLWTIAETSMAILGYEDCVIYLVDQSRGVLVQRAAFGPKNAGFEVADPIEIAIGAGIVGSVAASGRLIRVDDTRLDPRYIVDDAHRRSELAVPIIDQGEVIGVIDSEHSDVGFYNAADEGALTDLAALVASRVRTAITIEQLEQARADLAGLAATDELTGLPNRRAYEAHLEVVDDSLRPAVALIDLDGFKRINDEHGHAAGDDLLRHIAAAFVDATRATDQVARLGGDEFAVVLDSGDVETLRRVVGRLLDRIAELEWTWDGVRQSVTASAGIARSSGGTTWADADAALYLAKEQGKSRVVVHDPDDPRLAARDEAHRLALTARDSLLNDRFLLYGQPIVATDDPTNKPVMMEALLRHHAGTGPTVAPGAFLRAADQYGLIGQIDRWVVERVVECLSLHDDAPPVAVNVHPRTVVAGDLLSMVRSAVDRHGVDPQRLVIEITEAAAIEDELSYREVVSALRSFGVRVALDDFGGGWTSLAVARAVEVDIVKIDGGWVRDATTDALSRQVVESIATAARILEAITIAEWVEDDATRSFLSDLGVDLVQGYLTGRPQPLDVVEHQRSLR